MLNCVCARYALLKKSEVFYDLKNPDFVVGPCGPYAVVAPVHWHVVIMPKSGPDRDYSYK